jgi:hypothetical protein
MVDSDGGRVAAFVFEKQPRARRRLFAIYNDAMGQRRRRLRLYLWQRWLRSAIWSLLFDGEAPTTAPQRAQVETMMSWFAVLGRRTKWSVLIVDL